MSKVFDCCSRDFVLTPRLYKACRNDAETLCAANRDWHVAQREGRPADDRVFVFPCLVRHLYPGEDDEDNEEEGAAAATAGAGLSADCGDQVRASLRWRALSVNLHPKLEENCRTDLAAYCADVPDEDGKEFRCLQDNLDLLGHECKRSVVRQTKIEAKDATLNTKVMRACAEVIEEHCAQEVPPPIQLQQPMFLMFFL